MSLTVTSDGATKSPFETSPIDCLLYARASSSRSKVLRSLLPCWSRKSTRYVPATVLVIAMIPPFACAIFSCAVICTDDERDTDGERDLWFAVVQRALDDLTAEKPFIKRTAHDWLVSNRCHPGSFIWICHHLGIEPTAYRRRLCSILTPSD